MGLDITAYSRLKSVGGHVGDNEWCSNEDHVTAFAYDSFPQSFRGIPVLGETVGLTYRFLGGGCYERTDKSEVYDFRAGSYSGYNAWRDDLRKRFNPDTSPDMPFYELIFFADNEGCIGPEAAADLLADFRTHLDEYDAGAPEGDYFVTKYRDWLRAFELAADGGLVSFH